MKPLQPPPNPVTRILFNLYARWQEYRITRQINRKPVMSEAWRVAQVKESHFDRNVGN